MIERSDIRDRIVRAMLPLAAEQGWTWAALRAAARAAGEDPALAGSHFPAGPVGAIEAWLDLLNRETEQAAAAEDLAGLRVPARIRRVVELRLRALAPHKRALRRAMAILALPWNAGAALRAAARAADSMWHAAGDTSADFSWYTRRATLAGIYAATLAYWMRDDEPDIAGAMAFLDRRLADLGRLGRRRSRAGRAAA